MKDKKKVNQENNDSNQKTEGNGDGKINGKEQTKAVGRARHKYFDKRQMTPALLLAQVLYKFENIFYTLYSTCKKN